MSKPYYLPKLLIADDEPIILRSLQKRLLSLNYPVVSMAYNGSEAVDLTRETHPDIALLDIKMPGKMNGIDAARIIWHDLNVPVIFITAHSDEKFLNQVQDVVPLAYIIKPIQKSDLKIVLRIAQYKIDADRQLRENESRYRLLIDNASDVISHHSVDGTFINVSPSCFITFGYKPQELVGRNLTEFIYPRDLPKVKQLFQVDRSNQQQVTTVYRILNKQGDYVWVESAGGVFTENPASHEVILTTHDISERKLEEIQFVTDHRKLERTNIVLQEQTIGDSEIIEQLKIEKEKLKTHIQDKMMRTLLPIVNKLKATVAQIDRIYVEHLEDQLKQLVSSTFNNVSNPLFNLSAREIEICNLLAEGLSSVEIAFTLNISIRTVQTHRTHIRKKLGLQNQNINLKNYLKTIGQPN